MTDEITLQLTLFAEHGELTDPTLGLALNIWYVYDAEGTIGNIRAKAYMLSGSDWQKEVVLQHLAESDWRTILGGWFPHYSLTVALSSDGTPSHFLRFGKRVIEGIELFSMATWQALYRLPAGCPHEADSKTTFLVTPLYRHEDGRIAPLIQRADGTTHP